MRAVPTPDSGERLTDHQQWDETLRPQAPPPPSGHVYSENGQVVAELLVDIHAMLRGELAQLREVLEQVERGASTAADARGFVNGLTLRQHDWSVGAYCTQYCRLVTQHHTIESSWVFPHLKRSDAGLGPVVDRLQDEHEVIHGVIDSVDRALVTVMADGSDLEPLRHAVDVLTDTLLSHLAYEERQLIEPLARFGFAPGQV